MTAELENIHMLGLYAVLVPRVTLLSTYVTTLSPKDIFPPQQIDNSRHHDEVHLCPPCSFCLGLRIRACPTSCWYVVIKILFRSMNYFSKYLFDKYLLEMVSNVSYSNIFEICGIPLKLSGNIHGSRRTSTFGQQ